METATQENKLHVIVSESGLEQTKAQVLLEKFTGFFELASEWERKTREIVITDVSQKAEMKMAGEGRKFLKSKRIEIENARKMLKEESLREGKTIDSIATILKNLIEPLEDELEKKEKFAEIKAAEEKAARKLVRDAELKPYAEFVPFGIDIASMSEEDFGKLRDGAKMQYDTKIDNQRKAEEERIAQAKKDEEAREAQRLENIRLQKENEEKEKQLKAEREKAEAERKEIEAKAAKEKQAALAKAAKEKEVADAKLKKEREEKEKLERELKAKADAEAAELKAKQLAEKKAKAAPDKVKLLELAKTIDELLFPEVKSEEAKEILNETNVFLKRLTNIIRTKSEQL